MHFSTLSSFVKSLLSIASFLFTVHFASAQQVSGGGHHSLVLCADSTVKGFGENYQNQLADTFLSYSNVPMNVAGLDSVIAVSGGFQFSMALTSDGTVWAWGDNPSGQLGDGTNTNHIAPAPVLGLTNIVAISAGREHALALDNLGNVWAWGNNIYGQLGINSTAGSMLPVQIAGLTGVTAISAGDHHSMALKSGTVYSWGYNAFGQLGKGNLNNDSVPAQIAGLSGIIGVDAGEYHSLAVKSNGTAWAWGKNNEGQLGDGTTNNRPVPVLTSGLSNVIAVSAGGEHSLALKSDGTVWMWGYDMNPPRRLDGSGTGTLGIVTPVQVNGLTNITKISCGMYHNLAYQSNGVFWGWGENWSGQLGHGGPYQYTILDPVKVVCPCGSAITPTVSAGANVTMCPNTNITVTAAGSGLPPFEYTWYSLGYFSGYFTTTYDTISPSIFIYGSGTYTFITVAKDINLCSSQPDSMEVNVLFPPSSPTVAVNPFPTVCNGSSVTLTAGNTAATYYWLPGGSTASSIAVAPTVNSTYTLVTADASGCTSTWTQYIDHVMPAIDVHNVYCGGGNNGYALSYASGGLSPYTYAWSTGSTGSDTYGLAPANYTLTVTDANGCAATNTFTIVDPGPLTVAPTTVSNVTCNGYGNGQLVFNASGGTPPYYYYVVPLYFYTNDTVTYLGPGQYIVTVTDNGGCGASVNDTAYITEPAYLSSSVAGTLDVTCNGGNNGTIYTSVNGGTAPYTYAWSNGQTTANATGLAAGNYSVTISDSKGCYAYDLTDIIISEPSALSTTLTPTGITCNGGNNGSVISSVSGGTTPYSYLWSNSATTQSISALTAATYMLSVYDAYNCLATKTVTVLQPTAISTTLSSQVNASCNGNADGVINTITTGGTGPKTFAWSTSPVQTSPSANGLSAGTYTLTATDQAGCTAVTTYTVTEPAVLTSSVSTTATSCNNTCTGTGTVIPAGGTAPYTYLWGTNPPQGTSTASGLCIGDYIVGVLDSKGCMTSDTCTVTGPLPIPITATATPTSCGSANGTATASITGGAFPPFYVLWNTGDTGLMVTNLSAGIYRANVTDANGCFSFADALVSNSNGPNVSVSVITDATCYGLSTGAIDINVTGGSSPYAYAWSNGATTQDISNVAYGPYEIVVTDAGGCTATNSYMVNTPAPLMASPAVINSSCTIPNGTAGVMVNGGTAPYSFVWSSGSTTSAATPVGAGIYSVTITDSKGCFHSMLVAVQDSGGPVVYIDTIAAANCGSSGFVLLVPQDSSSISAYQWNTGNTTQNLTNANPGNYGVVITDTAGCKSVLITPVIPVLPPMKPICVVTVDTLTNMNIVVWEKPVSTVIAGFNIYRESSQPGIYQFIAYSTYSTVSTYYDPIANPDDRWAKYRISMKDICGAEGPLSPEHKTIHLSIQSFSTDSTNLIWDAYVGSPFTHYDIYRKDSAFAAWKLIGTVPSTTTKFLDSSFPYTGDTISYHVDVPHSGGDCIATLIGPQMEATSVKGSKSNSSERGTNPAGNSVAENSADNSVSIYPNPSHGLFTLDIRQGSPASVTVFNVLGEEVKQLSSNKNKTEVDLRKLSKGVYYLRIASNEKTITKKLIIE